MSEDTPPPQRPLLGLIVIGLLFLVPIAGTLIWQEVRWVFADPLAITFRDHDLEKDGNEVRGAAIRKFISMGVLEAGEKATESGFDCKAFSFTNSVAICYRDVWTRLCKDIWSLQLVVDDKKKISSSGGKKRRVCLFQ